QVLARADSGGDEGSGEPCRLAQTERCPLHRGKGVVHDRADGLARVPQALQLAGRLVNRRKALEALRERNAEARGDGGTGDRRARLEGEGERVAEGLADLPYRGLGLLLDGIVEPRGICADLDYGTTDDVASHSHLPGCTVFRPYRQRTILAREAGTSRPPT